jgi:hypothetical protein
MDGEPSGKRAQVESSGKAVICLTLHKESSVLANNPSSRLPGPFPGSRVAPYLGIKTKGGLSNHIFLIFSLQT